MQEPSLDPPPPTFPYPLQKPSSRDGDDLLVDWIRNHSSYLTIGSLAAKLGRVAAFIGGTANNWFLLIPWMLGVAYAIGVNHFRILDHPVTGWFWLTLAISIVVGIVFRNRGTTTPDEKSVYKERRRWNPTSLPSRILGCILLAGGIAVIVVLVPMTVEWIRDSGRYGRGSSWTLAGLLGAIAASLGAIQSLISNRMRWVLMLLQIFAALVGIGILLVALLVAEEFIVYGNVFRFIAYPGSAYFSLFNPILVAIVLSFACVGIGVCVYLRGYQVFVDGKWWKLDWTIRYQLLSAIAFVGVWAGVGLWMTGGDLPVLPQDFEQNLAKVRSDVGRQTRPISRFASVVPAISLSSLGADESRSSNPLVVNASIGQVVVEPTAANRPDSALTPQSTVWDPRTALDELFPETKSLFDELARRRIRLSEHYNLRPHGLFGADTAIENRDDWAIDYFDAAQRFVDLAGELGDLPPTHLAQLRSIVSEINRVDLKERLSTRFKNDSTEITQQLLLMQVIAEAAYQIQRQTLVDIGLPVSRDGNIDLAGLKSLIRTECSASTADDILTRLKKRTVNAYHQAEYAKLAERDTDNLQAFNRSGQTIASKGQIQLVPKPLDSGLEQELKSQIRVEVLCCILCQLDQATLSQLEVTDLAVGPESKPKAATLLELLQMSDHDLIVLATQCNEAAEPVERHHLALSLVLRRALDASGEERLDWLRDVGQLARPLIGFDSDQLKAYQWDPAQRWSKENLARGIMARFAVASNRPTEVVAADDVVLAIKNGGVPLADIGSLRSRVMNQALWPKTHLFLVMGLLIVLFGFFVDVNANSMHNYYRNHLVNAFFVTRPRSNADNSRKTGSASALPPPDVIVPDSVNEFRLTQLSPKGCAAPYLIVNGALNLQAVDDPKLRDRMCDPFFFSKRFCGSVRTSFLRSGLFEQVHREMNLGTAMAISAAAVAPNMGRRTNGFLVFIMTLLNVRLGYWVPNPSSISGSGSKGTSGNGIGQSESAEDSVAPVKAVNLPTRSFVVDWETVFQAELEDEISARRVVAYPESSERDSRLKELTNPDERNLMGLALSGGGIRSASFALGVLQALSDIGVFRHIDYLSTVSGGGYIGCGLSVAMARDFVNADDDSNGDVGNDGNRSEQQPERVFHDENGNAYANRRLSAVYYARELTSNLNTDNDWINVSDGGHIENLGAFELLRRRCRLIIVSDAEADPNYQFDGLATLIRLAKLELNTEIEIEVAPIRPHWPTDQSGRPIESKTSIRDYHSQSPFAIGTITYPPGDSAVNAPSTQATLVYLKSSVTGNEELPISEYRDRHPDFPHQPTSDQFFDQDQFDAYRLLGCKIALEAFGNGNMDAETQPAVFNSYDKLRAWLDGNFQETNTN
ncbi:hypothetical protein RISK_003235 [Rhodopirellula islandica]|uniref:PNPLA domain-containing protein n=1 Tax=Rhodopirellula islandica TaxID=595434 RepID=A0A0J1BDC9_RHOIS|nr:patatin-like phospholipase family protein [Rhodopirellula islandica]KLU04613.1 hypothetical protein RISK_003235 [Rhodopirellula islandica]